MKTFIKNSADYLAAVAFIAASHYGLWLAFAAALGV